MIVTKVHLRVELVPRIGSRLRAVGSLVLNGVFQIEYVKVVQKTDGSYLVQMPSQLGNDGVHHDVAHPVSRDLRASIDRAVMKEYHRMSKEKSLTQPHTSLTIDCYS